MLLVVRSTSANEPTWCRNVCEWKEKDRVMPVSDAGQRNGVERRPKGMQVSSRETEVCVKTCRIKRSLAVYRQERKLLA
jgi:hypothetical protein